MHINNFEAEVEDKIVKRGERYFSDGAVDELWQETDGGYHAVVDGSEPYEVMIELDADGEIADHSCDCPYDWGEYCKHEVAVLLAIRNLRASGTHPPTERQKKRRGLKALLDNYTKEDLIGLICTLSREYGLYEDIIVYFEEDVEEW